MATSKHSIRGIFASQSKNAIFALLVFQTVTYLKQVPYHRSALMGIGIPLHKPRLLGPGLRLFMFSLGAIHEITH